ncbi:hypothetical protein KIPB_005216 [Kipferlia bialata]|uniref:Uncharacterized protein n=1 Tax=Kipferlia bialata TaxID=797122 RepID=A0A9K3CX58_9EUKA|nr:hypothetical protein KIPB_005216 [Kipferlia bialata]|eukprot:g5216.t1
MCTGNTGAHGSEGGEGSCSDVGAVTTKRMRRKKAKRIQESFTKTDIHTYALHLVSTGIHAYSYGSNPLFPIDDNMELAERFRDFLAKGREVAFRCDGSWKLLKFLQYRTIEDGHLTEGFWDNMAKAGEVEYPGPSRKSIDCFQYTFRFVLPTLCHHYVGSFGGSAPTQPLVYTPRFESPEPQETPEAEK